MLKVTVMAVAAPFYGKKGSTLQPHLKDLFQKISPRRPNIPCKKPEQTDFRVQPKEIHPSYCCKARRNRRQVSILPLVTCWIVMCTLCLPVWWGKHLQIFVDLCKYRLLTALVPVTFISVTALSPCEVCLTAAIFRFTENACRGFWFCAASCGCDSITGWYLGYSTKEWFPGAAGNRTLLCFEGDFSVTSLYALPGYDVSNLKSATPSMGSSDFLRAKSMDLHTGPPPCLWFCSCSQWRHNCPWAAILHLCARMWFEVTIGYLHVYILSFFPEATCMGRRKGRVWGRQG